MEEKDAGSAGDFSFSGSSTVAQKAQGVNQSCCPHETGPLPFPETAAFEAAPCFQYSIQISASTDSLGSQSFAPGDIRFLILHNRLPQLQQLKTTRMCHLTVSRRQGSSLSLTRTPSQRLTGL